MTPTSFACPTINNAVTTFNKLNITDSLEIYLASASYNSDGNSLITLTSMNLTITPYDPTSIVIVDLGLNRFIQFIELANTDPSKTTHIQISNIQFINGYAPFGGLMYIVSNVTDLYITLDHCSLNNFTSSQAGALFFINANTFTSHTYINILYSNITNLAGRSGIAYSMAGLELNIDHSIISGAKGSLVYNKYGDLNITNSQIINNNNPSSGVLFQLNTLQDTAIIYNSKFINNTVKDTDDNDDVSSALFLILDTYSSFDTVEFTNNSGGSPISITRNLKQLITNTFIGNSKFIKNTNTKYGGAISLNKDGFLNINNTIFDSNQAQYGGAIYTVDALFATISNSRFENNTASTRGNSIYDSDTVFMNFTNTNFNGQVPAEIYCEGSVSSFGFYNVNSTSKLLDCIKGTCEVEGPNDFVCDAKDPNPKRSTGEIIGIVVGVLVGVIILSVILFLAFKRYKNRKQYLNL